MEGPARVRLQVRSGGSTLARETMAHGWSGCVCTALIVVPLIAVRETGMIPR